MRTNWVDARTRGQAVMAGRGRTAWVEERIAEREMMRAAQRELLREMEEETKKL